ncbi:MAG: ATP-binding protein, partial [Pseudomonadota bacterium]
ISGPVLALLTYGILSRSDGDAIGSSWFATLIVADICYLLILISLIGRQIARLVAERRAQSAGAQLHARMVTVFSIVAAAPAILVAAFFFMVMNLGFDAWFNDQVGSVVRNSREVARAYAEEHRDAIRSQAAALAGRLSVGASGLIRGANDPGFYRVLREATENSNFSEVFVINSSGDVIARTAESYLFTLKPPAFDSLVRARDGAIVIDEDRAANEMRALVNLEGVFDAFLYVSRPVAGAVLAANEQTARGAQLYERLERNRGAWVTRFAALYLGFAMLVLIAAIYLGLWFAERLTRPIGRLAAAAARVRDGDLVVRVKEERGDDEIALLSRVFNRMTEEVKRKQDALTVARQEAERGRLFSEAVVSGVSAGVIGLDRDGRVRLVNRRAAALLEVEPAAAVGRLISDVAPELEKLFQDASYDPTHGVEAPIRLSRPTADRELLARITSQRLDHHDEDAADATDDASLGAPAHSAEEVAGYVVTLDDLTDLLAAQRLAAWGDVARRVAHEIKNPLTPIQLAAERLRRKYGARLGDDADAFERYTETIVRQTAEIGRMVDAFVRFAKLPSPKMAEEDLVSILREAVLLQEEARANVRYVVAFEGVDQGARLPARCDRGQIIQALTNLLQNAVDSIQARVARDEQDGETPRAPEIRVTLRLKTPELAAISVADNGVGLPIKERKRLLEPYVTTRERGAGLGLAIVMKILEDHKGGFELADAEPFEADAPPGAAATMELPLAAAEGDGADASADRRGAGDADGGSDGQGAAAAPARGAAGARTDEEPVS